MIARMAKVRIVGPKSLLEPAVEQLQAAGVVHIESSPPEAQTRRLDRFSPDPAHLERKQELERLLKELNRQLLLLPPPPPKADAGGQSTEALLPRAEVAPVMDAAVTAAIGRALDEVGPRLDALLDQIRAGEEEASLLAKYERVLLAMAPLLEQIREVKGLDFLGVLLETPPREPSGSDRGALLEAIRQALAELTEGRYELFVSRIDPQTLAGLLVMPRELSTKIRAFLWQENISELRLPAALSDKPVGEALRLLLRRRAELPSQLDQWRGQLQELARRWRGRLQRDRRLVENWLAQLESTLYFFQTRATFLIYGWVPVDELVRLEQHIQEAFGGRVVLEQTMISEAERPQIPVALRNPPLVKPFERFTRLVALPRYGSIDPTPYLALFLPIFYGIILGDIGYGLFLLGGAWYVRKRWGQSVAGGLVSDLAAVFQLCAFWAIVFGLLYGEFFGELGAPLGIHPLLLNRLEGIMFMLMMTLGIGLAHLLLGIVLGLIVAARHRARRELLTKGAGLLSLLAVLASVGALAGLIDQRYAAPAALLALLALVPMIVAGGARAALELHNVVNLFSYLRLMGIGVASAALAFAANTLGGLFDSVVLGAIVGLLFHLINLLFGIVSPMVQSLRLHVVEFFENFFQAGGRAYQPFKQV